MQRRIWRLITDPDGVEAASATETAGGGPAIDRFVRADRGLAACDRLAVYANAYFVRIHDCLREDHPALAATLGEAAFHDLVRTYLMMHPPSRPSLRHAGEKLASHLRTEPFAAIFGKRCPYAADLAALEWAIVDAFDAPDAAPIGTDALARIPAERWASLRLEPTPSLRMLRCEWPVHRVRERFDREGAASRDEANALASETTHARVWRREERVLYRSMDRVEAAALERLEAGDSFASMCDRIGAETDESQVAGIAAGLLAAWIGAGLLVGVR